jgi:hypothetical protein
MRIDMRGRPTSIGGGKRHEGQGNRALRRWISDEVFRRLQAD